MKVEPGQIWDSQRTLWFIIAPYIEYDGHGNMFHVGRVEPSGHFSYQLLHEHMLTSFQSTLLT